MSFALYTATPFTSGVTVVSSGFLDYLRTTFLDAVDGSGGGTYALTAPLTFTSQLVTMDDLTLTDALIAVSGTFSGNVGAVDGTFSGAVTAGDALYVTGVISPSLTGSVNNWAPSGFANASVIRIGSDGVYNITGLAGGTAGRQMILLNVSASAITLSNDDGSSTAANKFLANASVVLSPEEAITIWYDGTSSRWRMLTGV